MRAGISWRSGKGGRGLRAALGATLGISFGLFVSGYWLIDLLPAQSRQLLLLTAVVAMLGAVLYFFLLGWVWDRIRDLHLVSLLLTTLASLVLTVFLLFAGTQQWRVPGRYVGFLLPRHQLRISATSAAADSVRLIWLNSALGDVSFSDLKVNGWTRQGDALVVNGSADNSLQWMGVTGDRIQMVIEADRPNVKVVVSWDGHDDAVTLDKGKNSYDRSFVVPFEASRDLIIVLGLLNGFVLSAALVLLLVQRRAEWQGAFEQSVSRNRGLDRRDVAGLVTAAGLALLLRVFNLGNVFPAVDEYYHLIAARQILQGAQLATVYQRSLWTVTVPIVLAFKVWGQQVWAARLVGVLVSALAAIPLYLLTRKINRPTALIACALYASSPWIVAFARMAREYAFYPFYFYWILYAMIVFVEAVPAGFVLTRDWRQLLRAKPLLLAAFLCVPPTFGLVVDWLSTFRTILIAYLVLGLVLLTRFDWRDRRNWPFLAAFLAAVVYGGRAFYLEQSSKLFEWPQLNPVPLEYFFPNPQQQWYFDRAALIVVLAVAAGVVYACSTRRINVVPSFLLLLLLAYLGVFAFFSKSFFHTRHLLTTELWYAVVVAMGVFALWTLLVAVVPLGRTLPRVALALGLGLATMNGGQVLVPSVSANPDMPISEDYLHDMSRVQAFMADQTQPGDVLISTVYGLYASWEQMPRFRTLYRITSTTPKADMLALVDSNPSGWIVIDKIRLDISTLSTKDFSELKDVQYVGTFGDEFVWHWQHPLK